MDIAITIIIFIVNLIISALIAVGVSFIRIGQYKNKVDTIETTIGKDEHCGLRKTLTDAKTEVDKLLEFKTNTQKFIDSNIYKNQSPLSLTEFGEQLIKDSGFETIFLSEKDELVKLLEKIAPKTQYDVQEKARGLMNDLEDFPAFEPIKEYAFKNGKDFGQILRAGAILLRNYYFEKHPEITR